MGKLLFRISQLHDGSERALGDGAAADDGGKIQDRLFDLWREAEHAHDLRHSRPSESLSSCDFRLTLDLARVELLTPLLGLPEELRRPRQLKLPEGFGRPPGFRGYVHDAVSGDAACQGAHAPVLERPLWPQGNLNGLFV